MDAMGARAGGGRRNGLHTRRDQQCFGRNRHPNHASLDAKESFTMTPPKVDAAHLIALRDFGFSFEITPETKRAIEEIERAAEAWRERAWMLVG